MEIIAALGLRDNDPETTRLTHPKLATREKVKAESFRAALDGILREVWNDMDI